MIADTIISDLATFASEHNYESIRGELLADIESPDDYDLSDQINILIHPSGRYMLWYHSELQQRLTGIYDEGWGKCRINIPTHDMETEDFLAAINGICARVMKD